MRALRLESTERKLAMDPNEKNDDKSEEEKEEDDYQEWCEDQRVHGDD